VNNLKIYLADLVHSIPGNYVVPLNIAYLASYSKFIFGDILDITLFKDPNALLNAVKKEAPDIVGFSNYSWNYDLNYQIGNYIKSNFPSTTIIMGGCGIRTDNDGIKSFLKKNYYVDCYMMFEGELPFVNFLKEFMNGQWRGNVIKGCAYLNPELIYSPCDVIMDLDKIPSVYLGGYLDEFLGQGYIPLIETNRGCPFSCTYCTWGISAHKKIRKFSLDRVYAEMEYIVSKIPKSSMWIFADANFGLFERDVQIAERIKNIRERYPVLQKVFVYTSHNRNDELNLKISDHLGNLNIYLIAVQSFDPIVQKNIKRANVRDEDIPNILQKVKAIGVDTSVDIIMGLPEETRESHLNTLRKCFELGFDFIDVLNIRMLPGSVLETDEQRKKYDIKTKYRLIQGSYGVYQGIKCIDAEECIRSDSTMTEDDMLYFRLVHWLVWFGWNAKFLAPIMKYLSFKGINPIGLITKIIDTDKSEYPLVNDLFDRFQKDAIEEWFDTYDDLRNYYLDEKHFNELMNGSFSKLNFKYMTEMILSHDTYLSFLEYIKKIVSEQLVCEIPADIFAVVEGKVIDADELNGDTLQKKILRVSTDIIPFLNLDNHTKEYQGEFAEIYLYKNDEYVKALKELYGKFSYNLSKKMAIEKILEHFTDGFTYNISLGKAK
jgi:radical SAM superfamily enzyme YgiQ (UPF0313 family)